MFDARPSLADAPDPPQNASILHGRKHFVRNYFTKHPEDDIAASGPRQPSVYDPKTKKWALSTRAYNPSPEFAEDADNTFDKRR
jgi:hypothetical protein